MTFGAYVKTLARVYGAAGRPLDLARAANDAKLRALEKRLGWNVPARLRGAWQTCDGADCPFFARPGFLTAYAFLSVDGAARARDAMHARAPRYAGYESPNRRDPRIRPGWFEPGWLPFASFGGDSLLLLVDTTPSQRGKKGQVIAFTHDPDEIEWVAPSFDALLVGSKRAFAAEADELLAGP